MNHQQQIAVLLFFYSMAFILWRIHSNKQSKRLSKIESKLQIATEKLTLYRLFVSNTPVKSFFRFIEAVNVEVFDINIKAMLIKYFDKVFINLHIAHTAMLIDEIKTLKHSEIIMDAFIGSNQRIGMNLIGLALAEATQECNNEGLLTINGFLQLLSPEEKREQIIVAIDCMKGFLSKELGDHIASDYRIEMEAALKELQKRVE